jgi:hypothetical protein
MRIIITATITNNSTMVKPRVKVEFPRFVPISLADESVIPVPFNRISVEKMEEKMIGL